MIVIVIVSIPISNSDKRERRKRKKKRTSTSPDKGKRLQKLIANMKGANDPNPFDAMAFDVSPSPINPPVLWEKYPGAIPTGESRDLVGLW